jgi:large conductance mechanosensitive channel
MSVINEFKAFALKGNVMDLAIGVIIGAAFGKIVDSVVADLIMPVVAALIGGKLDFSSLLIPLGQVPAGTAMTLDALKKAGVPVFAYGSFVTILINFVLLALIIFSLVKVMNRWKQEEPAPAPEPAAPPASEVLLAEIRDLLKQPKA